MRKLRFAAIAASILSSVGVSACASHSGPATYTLLAAAPDTAPLSVAAPLAARQAGRTEYNQWGGTIPDAKPTIPVDDGGLGELPN